MPRHSEAPSMSAGSEGSLRTRIERAPSTLLYKQALSRWRPRGCSRNRRCLGLGRHRSSRKVVGREGHPSYARCAACPHRWCCSPPPLEHGPVSHCVWRTMFFREGTPADAGRMKAVLLQPSHSTSGEVHITVALSKGATVKNENRVRAR